MQPLPGLVSLAEGSIWVPSGNSSLKSETFTTFPAGVRQAVNSILLPAPVELQLVTVTSPSAVSTTCPSCTTVGCLARHWP